MFSRLYLGLGSYFNRRRAFPWVHSLICIITIACCFLAFIPILRDTGYNKGRILILVGTNVVHAFLARLAFQQHKFSDISYTPTFLIIVIIVNFVALPINTLPLLLPDISAFLLMSIYSFLLNKFNISSGKQSSPSSWVLFGLA